MKFFTQNIIMFFQLVLFQLNPLFFQFIYNCTSFREYLVVYQLWQAVLNSGGGQSNQDVESEGHSPTTPWSHRNHSWKSEKIAVTYQTMFSYTRSIEILYFMVQLSYYVYENVFNAYFHYLFFISFSSLIA